MSSLVVLVVQRNQVLGVVGLGKRDGRLVPASPACGLVACHQQNHLPGRIENGQDPDLGLAYTGRSQLLQVVQLAACWTY
jgi:hypothetical protein